MPSREQLRPLSCGAFPNPEAQIQSPCTLHWLIVPRISSSNWVSRFTKEQAEQREKKTDTYANEIELGHTVQGIVQIAINHQVIH